MLSFSLCDGCQGFIQEVTPSSPQERKLAWESTAWDRLASFPGSSRGGGERAWYTLYAHVPGDPRKMWDNRILLYTLRLSSIELYVMQNPRMITMVTRPITMETPAHARAMCTRPFLLLLKAYEGPGNEARDRSTIAILLYYVILVLYVL